MSASPKPSGMVTLLTDFGVVDPFVGVMTGALLSRAPGVRVVDLCHGIRPGGIAEGAFWLERCYRWFPPGTVHLAVIDPGVGSARRVLAARFGGHYFVLPDNGLLSPALLRLPDAQVRHVALERLSLPAPSATFHGRDIFAPLAADLASGTRTLESLGEATVPLPCPLPSPTLRAAAVSGQVVTCDRYGNLISNVDRASVAAIGGNRVRIAARELPLLRTYSDAAPGQLLALVNAFDVIEVAERDGNAARRLGVSSGVALELLGARPEPE